MLLHKAVLFVWDRGNFNDSRKMVKRVMRIRNALFRGRNKEILISFNILSLVYNLGGAWKKAEDL